jgi:hypothetical protein
LPWKSEEIALRKIHASSKVNELRNLGALAYETKCTWEYRVKKVVLRLGGVEELGCST